jgi:hypothetical protein
MGTLMTEQSGNGCLPVASRRSVGESQQERKQTHGERRQPLWQAFRDALEQRPGHTVTRIA